MPEVQTTTTFVNGTTKETTVSVPEGSATTRPVIDPPPVQPTQLPLGPETTESGSTVAVSTIPENTVSESTERKTTKAETSTGSSKPEVQTTTTVVNGTTKQTTVSVPEGSATTLPVIDPPPVQPTQLPLGPETTESESTERKTTKAEASTEVTTPQKPDGESTTSSQTITTIASSGSVTNVFPTDNPDVPPTQSTGEAED